MITQYTPLLNAQQTTHLIITWKRTFKNWLQNIWLMYICLWNATQSTTVWTKNYRFVCTAPFKMAYSIIQYTNSLPVVGCRENRDTFSIMCHFVAVLLDFMTSDNVTEVILLQEPLSNIWAKLDSNSSLAWRPTTLRLRIRPKQFTHQPWKNTSTQNRPNGNPSGSLGLAKIYLLTIPKWHPTSYSAANGPSIYYICNEGSDPI